MQLEPELVPSTLTAQIWKDRKSFRERLAETMNGLEVNQMNKYVEASFYPLAKNLNAMSQINTWRCFFNSILESNNPERLITQGDNCAISLHRISDLANQ